MACKAYFQGLSSRIGEFEERGAVVHGISADGPAALQRFTERCQIDPRIEMLSDPELATHEAWNIPLGRKHPMARRYPRKAFLQPAVLLFDRSGSERFDWRVRPGLLNLYGATGRISPSEILETLDRCRS